MAQQTINIGTVSNDGTGDPLRTAFDKANDNFTELYASGDLSGTGTVTFIPKFDGTNSIADSQLRDNGSNVVSQGVAAASHDSYYASVMQVGTISLGSPETAADNVVAGNLYYTGTPVTWGRIVDGAGSFMSLSDGIVVFATLSSGTAGTSGITSERMRITNNGNIGIGLTNPSNKLQVDGNVRIDNGIITGTTISTRTLLSSGTDVDFETGAIFVKTLTVDTTLTFSNTGTGMVRDIIVTGDFVLTLPTGNLVAGAYDGTVDNLIQVVCTAPTEYWYSISQPQ